MRAAATAAASPVVKTTTGADVTREFDCAMYPLVQMLSQAHKARHSISLLDYYCRP